MSTKNNTERTYELRYTGWLTESTNTPIYLHYGTENWTEVSETKMRKLKNCYKTEITVPSSTRISFCFRDTEGNWDNNSGNDYWYTPSIGETYSCVEITDTTADTGSTTTTGATTRRTTTGTTSARSTSTRRTTTPTTTASSTRTTTGSTRRTTTPTTTTSTTSTRRTTTRSTKNS